MRTYAVHPQKGGASSYDGSDWKDCAITHMIFLILLCQVSGLFFPQTLQEYYWPCLILLVSMCKAIKSGWEGRAMSVIGLIAPLPYHRWFARRCFFLLVVLPFFSTRVAWPRVPGCLWPIIILAPMRRYTHKRAGQLVMEAIGVIGLS